MICTGSSNSVAESGRQVGMAVDHRAHRIAQPVGVERAAHRDVQLHRIHIVAGPCATLAWNSSPCCSGVSGNTSATRYCRQQLVDLLLAQPGRGDIGGGQPAPAAAHMRADAGQGLEPQPAQPADLLLLHRRGRPRPVGLQMRAGVGVGGAGIELDGVRQRQR